MLRIKLNEKGRKVNMQLQNLKQINQTGIRQGYWFLGKDLVKVARDSISAKPKSGKTYLINRNGRTIKHVASAPGEAPARLFGPLQKSINFIVNGWKQMIFGANTPYAPELELGSSRVEKRPYLWPAILSTQGLAVRHFTREIQKAHKL